MISVVILNWKRPNNIIKDILPEIVNYKLVNEVIISHGNKETYFKTPEYSIVKHYHDADLNDTLGVARRFLRATHANNDCILILDDDRLPSENYVNRIYEEYKKDPYTVIGTEKRYVSFKNGYNKDQILSYKKPEQGDILIVLTQTLMTNKQLCKNFMDKKDKMNDFALKAKPIWNGEDILFNLIFIKDFNKKPIYIKPENERKLKTNDAINDIPGHYTYREKFARAALERYEIVEHNSGCFKYTTIFLLLVLYLLFLIFYIFRLSG
jgi:hypothetical protein